MPSKTSISTIIVFSLIAILLSGCSLFVGQKPAALQVTTTPQASVFLDGKHLGKTPFFSDQLKVGEYTLKISQGEAVYLDRINLNGGTLTVINRKLAQNPENQSGENLQLESGQKGLFIASIPNDAEITIDGKYKGKTPILIKDIENADHKVIISKNGYNDHEFAIKTSPRYQLVADVTLSIQNSKDIETQSEAKTPKVSILSTPQGFLRVRSEPSLSAPEVGRVKTSDELELIQEIGEWFKIKFEGKLGWISSQYAQKL